MAWVGAPLDRGGAAEGHADPVDMSLNTHLRTMEDHATLSFDPACPVCREERLAGRLPAATLVSPRLTALAVAGVTAGCALAPAPGAIAQEPPLVLPPGGYEDPGEEALEDEGPLVEDEPVESAEPDPNLPPAVLPDDPATAIDPADPPPPVDPAILAGEPVPATPPPPPPPPPPSPAAPAPGFPAGGGARAPARGDARAQAEAGTRAGTPRRALAGAAPGGRRRDPGSSRRDPSGAPGRPAPAGPGYVVRPGDSLWSIAHARLGAQAEPAAVAAFVQAIWRANAAVIRTGDPDLLLPGTRLVLPGAPG